MKEWLTAREIVDEDLPQTPSSVRGVLDVAEREGWNADEFRARKRSGRGGGQEYHIGLLPSVAQIAYRSKHIRVGQSHLPPAANDEAPAPTAALSGRAALERDARLAVLRAFETYARGQRLNLSACEYGFVLEYQAGNLVIDDWVRQCVPSLSRRTLGRWRAEALKDRDRLAVDRSTARKGKGVIEIANDGAVRLFVLALVADNAHFSAEHIRDLVEAEFGATLTVISKGVPKTVPLPPVRTFQHALKALKTANKVVLTKIQNPDLFRSTLAPAGSGTLSHVTEANVLWQIDASPVDALCTDGRHAIYVCTDIATRRLVLFVSRTPRASAVALLIRKAILEWGAPVTIKTDNGSDFTARDTKRLFDSLGIAVELSDAYTPQQKGHVERAIGTFQRDCATMLPGFVGHDVADRKAIENRKSFAQRLGTSDEDAFGVELSGDDLQAIVDRWVATYHQKPHAGLKGETPFNRAIRSTALVRSVDERALDLLLMSAAGGGGKRTVTKMGLRIDGRFYMTPTILPGTDVFVRMDSADLGLVYAFSLDGGTFLGVGICPTYSGIAPETAASILKSMQTDIVSQGAAVIKAEIRRVKKGAAYHERILSVRESRAPNVLILPKRDETHTTPQIAAAIEATEAFQDRHSRVVDPSIAAEQRRLIAEMEADAARPTLSLDERLEARAAAAETARVGHLPPAVTALPESPKARYRRFDAIQRAVDAGEPVDVADAIACGRYQATSEYRGQRALHEDYGDEYLAL